VPAGQGVASWTKKSFFAVGSPHPAASSEYTAALFRTGRREKTFLVRFEILRKGGIFL